jgi:hypothetical protein
MNSVVVSTCFTSRLDPQRRIGHPADSFELMRVWYESIHRVGVRGLIFHDQLSDAFIATHRSELVDFAHHQPISRRSVNDERFICYLDWLYAHPEVDNVFMLDLYCGGDPGEFNDKFNRGRMIAAYGHPHHEHEIKLHAGTAGGRWAAVIRLLEYMREEFAKLDAAGNFENLNMPVFNKSVYDLFASDRILKGYPLNSRFKQFERSGDFAIRHK